MSLRVCLRSCEVILQIRAEKDSFTLCLLIDKCEWCVAATDKKEKMIVLTINHLSCSLQLKFTN